MSFSYTKWEQSCDGNPVVLRQYSAYGFFYCVTYLLIRQIFTEAFFNLKNGATTCHGSKTGLSIGGISLEFNKL